MRAHEGLEHNQSKDYLNLLTQMLQTPWVSEVRAKDPPGPPPAAEEDGKTGKKETKENKDEKETKEEKDKEPMPPVQPVGHKCSNICEVYKLMARIQSFIRNSFWLRAACGI